MTKPPDIPYNVTMKWFAVVHRYGCKIETKVSVSKSQLIIIDFFLLSKLK